MAVATGLILRGNVNLFGCNYTKNLNNLGFSQVIITFWTASSDDSPKATLKGLNIVEYEWYQIARVTRCMLNLSGFQGRVFSYTEFRTGLLMFDSYGSR